VVIGFVETLAGPVQVLEIRKVGAAWPACRLNLRGQKGLARAAEIPRVPGLCDVGHGLNHLARIQRQTDALLAIAILLSLIELEGSQHRQPAAGLPRRRVVRACRGDRLRLAKTDVENLKAVQSSPRCRACRVARESSRSRIAKLIVSWQKLTVGYG